ncbi:leucine-rich repeat-containing protein 52 [Lissotriton helveticus]
MARDTHGPQQRARCQPMSPHRARRPLGALLLLLAALGRPAGGCPKACACEQHLLVNCTRTGLDSFPPGIPLDTRQLVLAGNRLSTLPSVSLNILMDLVYLDCSGNELGESLEATFLSLPLVYLDLSFNNLSRVSASTFSLLVSLVVLKLSDNPGLVEVERGAFANNTGLRELDLSRSGLTFLDASTVSQLPNLRTLGLGSNPWHCYCPLRELSSWLETSSLYFPDADNISCHSPQEVKGVLLSAMGENMDLMCFTNLYQKDYLFLMLIGFAIFSTGTAVAWITGVCIVLYNRLCKSKDDDEDYEETQVCPQPPGQNAKDEDFEVYINAYV